MDNCSIDVNETISNLVKSRYEKKEEMYNNNSNIINNNQGNRSHQLMNTDQISDTDLINRAIQRIANIKLNI